MKSLLLILAIGIFSAQSHASTIQGSCYEFGDTANAQRKIKSLATHVNPGHTFLDIQLEDSQKTYTLAFRSGAEAMLFLNQLKNQDSNGLQFSLGNGNADISRGKSDLSHCYFENGYTVTSK